MKRVDNRASNVELLQPRLSEGGEELWLPLETHGLYYPSVAEEGEVGETEGYGRPKEWGAIEETTGGPKE